jgi:hypothetical protein
MSHLITLALMALTSASSRNVPEHRGSSAPVRPRSQRQKRRSARR